MSLFVRLFVGLAGGSSSLCVSVYWARAAKSFVQWDRRIYINTDVGFACWCFLVFCFCLFFMSKWEIEGLSTDIIKYLDVQELHITHLCRWFQNTATLKTFFENWRFWLYPVILNHIHSSIASDISRDCNFKSNCHNADCFQSLKHNLDDQFFKKHCNFLQWHLFRELVRKQIIKVLFPWRCAISIFTF